MHQLSSRSIQNYAIASDQIILYDFISTIFPDLKRRQKVSLIRDCVFRFQEWIGKLETRRPKHEALLQLLYKRI